MEQKQDNKYYWMKLKKQLSKSGKTYYTGKFAYALDVIGFEKDDGTVTLWLKPQDMDKMRQEGFPNQFANKPQQQIQPRPPVMQQFDKAVQQQRQVPPQIQPKVFVDHTKPDPNWTAPSYEDEDIPF